jgi:hypothetical protein
MRVMQHTDVCWSQIIGIRGSTDLDQPCRLRSRPNEVDPNVLFGNTRGDGRTGYR